jgi:cellobiose phosphorylase
VEDVLGLRVRAGKLELSPCVARGWKGYRIYYRYVKTEYRIEVDNAAGVERGVRSCTLDGKECDARAVPLADDGGRHEVRVVMGSG